MSEFKTVKKFMEAAGQEVPDRPTVPHSNTRQLRLKLIREEVKELCSALALFDLSYMRIGKDAKEHQVTALTELADAISDSIYVINGTAVAFGLPQDTIFDIVHLKNMEKIVLAQKAVMRADGKVLKPPGFEGPEKHIKVAIERAITHAEQRDAFLTQHAMTLVPPGG